VGNSGENLQGDVRLAANVGQLPHLASHDVGRADEPVQREFIDYEPRERGIIAVENTLLPRHALSMRSSYDGQQQLGLRRPLESPWLARQWDAPEPVEPVEPVEPG
jgi:hypothetical protein